MSELVQPPRTVGAQMAKGSTTARTLARDIATVPRQRPQTPPNSKYASRVPVLHLRQPEPAYRSCLAAPLRITNGQWPIKGARPLLRTNNKPNDSSDNRASTQHQSTIYSSTAGRPASSITNAIDMVHQHVTSTSSAATFLTSSTSTTVSNGFHPPSMGKYSSVSQSTGSNNFLLPGSGRSSPIPKAKTMEEPSQQQRHRSPRPTVDEATANGQRPKQNGGMVESSRSLLNKSESMASIAGTYIHML
jgi:hypothetical protein